MSMVNKQSLREEFDTMNAQFENLCAEGKMSSDSRALFQTMANNGYNPLIAVQMALSGQVYDQRGEELRGRYYWVSLFMGANIGIVLLQTCECVS